MIQSNVKLVISNNSDSYALKRASLHAIPNHLINNKCTDNVEETLLHLLDKHQIDIIFLAGYLKKLDNKILEKYHNRILNIHPSLLPKYGGKGMYGIHIHEAILAAKEKYSGVTIHKVNGDYDTGEIINQIKIDISACDTPLSLQNKILEVEHQFIVKTLLLIEKGALKLQ